MLTVVEARVLGCLLEKQRTVPDQYPLTLNALVSACNQSTSREPIMHLDDHQVESAIGTLKTSGLARLVHPSHGRSVTRYRQVADEVWELDSAQAAVVSVLLLRGPQTVAEIRTRTERQHGFGSLDAVQEVLDGLQVRGLVQLLGRQPGRKEPRWQQLLADEADRAAAAHEPVAERAWASNPAIESTIEPGTEPATQPGAAPIAAPSAERIASLDAGSEMARRIADLEARVAVLEAALADLL